MLISLFQALTNPNADKSLVMLAFGGFALALILGITLHEFAHALVAYRLGDLSPLRDGRLTINPLAHLDPFGTLLILLAGFGYGRPVMVNPYAFRMNPRTGMALVALAGPVTNVIIATVFGIPLRILLDMAQTSESALLPYVIIVFSIMVSLNLVLAIFNMIPFPPLDGSKVLLALLPPDMSYSVEKFYLQTQQYGLLVLFALMWVGGRFIGPLIDAPANALYVLIVGQPPLF